MTMTTDDKALARWMRRAGIPYAVIAHTLERHIRTIAKLTVGDEPTLVRDYLMAERAILFGVSSRAARGRVIGTGKSMLAAHRRRP